MQIADGLLHLVGEVEESDNIESIQAYIDHLDECSYSPLMKELLCVRPPDPPLPEKLLLLIDDILLEEQSCKLLTKASSIPPIAKFRRDAGEPINISLWQGDITTLSEIEAITNAANEQGLGCFQPTHKCIDNIIHSNAGPRLRSECLQILSSELHKIAVGDAIVTKGYCLPASSVIHTVGPQLSKGMEPKSEQCQQLAQCYRSVLSAADNLPTTGKAHKAIALCGISTGLFAFPVETAATIAIETVAHWLEEHPGCTITHVIFNMFTDNDTSTYEKLFNSSLASWDRYTPDVDVSPVVHSVSIDVAHDWLRSADAIIVSAGAGLSAADGLDYTSTGLFREKFHGFLEYGLTTLYSVFGFSEWASQQDRWSYYWTHLAMIASWPPSDMYRDLITWLKRFGPKAHVRTSNADGFFVAHGWPAEQLSTPQGSYSVLQCLANCRPDSTVQSTPLLLDAIPFIDPKVQRLTNLSKIPLCPYCGGDMSICVRAGSWFNGRPFEAGEKQWRDFKRMIRTECRETVVLELGVGMNTPGVLRWPNEDLVQRGNGTVKLIRVGLGSHNMVPDILKRQHLAVSIDGDIKLVLKTLLAGL